MTRYLLDRELPYEPKFDIAVSPNRAARVEPVEFVCFHWTGGTFRSAVDWCLRPESVVSYHEIIDRNGDTVQLVPFQFAAWSNGDCKNPDPARFSWTRANSASDNIALSGAPPTPPTTEQVVQAVKRAAERFRVREWTASETWRVLGHSDIAIYTARYTQNKALWGKYGRKPDPWGHGWLNMRQIRADVADAVNDFTR